MLPGCAGLPRGRRLPAVMCMYNNSSGSLLSTAQLRSRGKQARGGAAARLGNAHEGGHKAVHVGAAVGGGLLAPARAVLRAQRLVQRLERQRLCLLRQLRSAAQGRQETTSVCTAGSPPAPAHARLGSTRIHHDAAATGQNVRHHGAVTKEQTRTRTGCMPWNAVKD
jgi:hypothetical protein